MAKKIEDRIDPIIEFDVPIEDRFQHIIKVIGVGGAGCNAVRNMYLEGIEGVTFAVCNTDSQQLSQSPVPVKLLLGAGLGAGGNPEKGLEEATRNIDQLRTLLADGTKMVFVTAGMGGGTGTGAAPLVAELAKDMGILTVGVVTIPFYFEKKKKILQALRGVEQMRQHVDALLIINNERLCDVYADSDISMKQAFKYADDILKDAVKSIAELITVHTEGDINLDFRDVESTTLNGGSAIMAMGRARGEHRVEKAIIDALDSPLLFGNDIGKAKRILFNISTSDDHPIFVREMQEIDEFFDILSPNIDVIWGTSTDNTLGEDVKVTVLATGMEDSFSKSARTQLSPDGHLEDLIPELYKPLKKPGLQIKRNDETADNNSAAAPSAEDDTLITQAETVPVEIEHPEEEIGEESPEKEDIEKPSPIVSKWKRWLTNLIQEPEE